MENCAAELVIYVPKGGAPSIAKAIIEAIPGEPAGHEGPLAFAAVFGGTMVIRDSNAPYGNPYGIRPEDLPPAIDWDLHVAAHYEWEAVIVRKRAGVRTEIASASCEPEPLMSRGDLDRIIEAEGGARAALESRLRSFFETPPPGYGVGARRVSVDWDGNVTDEAAPGSA